MEQGTVPSIFDSIHDTTATRRKEMIPRWMWVFAWIFAILSPLSMLMMLVVTLLYERISYIPNMQDLTAKYDSSGAVIWARSFGGRLSESVYTQAVSRDGDIYLGGFYYSDSLVIGGLYR